MKFLSRYFIGSPSASLYSLSIVGEANPPRVFVFPFVKRHCILLLFKTAPCDVTVREYLDRM